jgi:HSP20 family molecular chaperone IbpA
MGGSSLPSRTAPSLVQEDEGRLQVVAQIPGMSARDVEVTVQEIAASKTQVWVEAVSSQARYRSSATVPAAVQPTPATISTTPDAVIVTLKRAPMA